MIPSPKIPPLPALSLVGSTKYARIFSTTLFIVFFIVAIGLIFLPWRQFVRGTGRVIAFDPLDRRINVESQVSGRVKTLHVVEGQTVKTGDLIVEIQDNDPNLIQNLESQRQAIEARRTFAQSRVDSLGNQIVQQELAKNEALNSAKQRVIAARVAAETAALNFERTEKLFKKLLESERNLELAALSRDSTTADLTSAEANLKGIESTFDAAISSTEASRGTAQSEVASADRDLTANQIEISRNLRQNVTAPRDGVVLSVPVTDGTYLSPGSPICVIIPVTESRFVEVWVDGNDLPLIQAKTEKEGKTVSGSTVRLTFEGWPAIQSMGWPQLAINTFGGEVLFVDPTDGGNGRFRVVIGATDDIVDRNDGQGPVAVGWPDGERWLRQGTRANALVMLKEVPLWFEVWRQINGFPPLLDGNQETLDPTKKKK
jgi:multidrug resistance efflux pump